MVSSSFYLIIFYYIVSSSGLAVTTVAIPDPFPTHEECVERGLIETESQVIDGGELMEHSFIPRFHSFDCVQGFSQRFDRTIMNDNR